MDHKEIRKFVERMMPELDEPGSYVPVVNQYLTKEEDWGEDKTRILYSLPVPESAAIQNLGIAILTQIGNEEMGPDYLASVSYFPETKMWKRMIKHDVPMFDNWLFHEWRDFDVVGISSFYALQYLNFIQSLERAHIPYKSEERINSWDYPIVGLGGIQTYSAETVADCFDVFFIGEGEQMNVEFLHLLRKMKKEGKSKREFLLTAARDIQGIYLPWAYEVEYYPSEGDEEGNHKNQIKDIHLTEEALSWGVPKKVLKGCIEFRDRPPVSKTFVSNNAGGSMSIGSCYCANSCSNLCSFAVAGESIVQTPEGFREFRTLKVGDQLKGFHSMRTLEKVTPLGLRDCIKVTTRNGYTFTVDRKHPVEVVTNNVDFSEILAEDLEVGDMLPVSLVDCGVFPDDEIPISFVDTSYDEALFEKRHWIKPDPIFLPPTFNEDLGFLVGFIAGDGTIRYDRDTCILHTVSNAPEVADRLKAIMDSILGKDKGLRLIHETTITPAEKYDATDVLDYQIDSRFFVRWLKSLGLKHSCYDVKVPEIIWKSPKNVICQFLRGLFEADGTVSKEGTVSFVTASKQLAEDVQQLMAGLGICTDLIPRRTNKNPSYVVVIVGVNGRINYAENIFFESYRKQKRLSERLKKAEGSAVYRSRKKPYHLVEVVDLEETSAEVYEVNVDGDHLFMINGVLTHNCQGSQISLPFREVPQELAEKSAREIIQNTGTKDLSPYCFNVSDLSYVNRFTADLLLKDHIKVSLSSERLDTMNDDFVKATIKSGSKSFTVAVEAASPRGRHILNKNLTEEQILSAFEIMFRNGALKIKVYNIASWFGEKEEDRMYYVDLCKKIEALREKYKAKTQIRLSFTPLVA